MEVSSVPSRVLWINGGGWSKQEGRWEVRVLYSSY